MSGPDKNVFTNANEKILKSSVLDIRDASNTLVPPCTVTMSTVVFEWEVDYVARWMRPADKREIEDALPMGVDAVLRESIRQSPRSRVIRRPARLMPWEPIAIFGIVPWEGIAHAARPWMLGARALDNYSIRLLRFAGDALKQMCGTEFTYLENHVHSENEKSIKMLTWMGFTLADPAPWGAKGALYRRFWKNMETGDV